MLKKITNSIWKLNLDSNMYFLEVEQKILIDSGSRMKRELLKMFLPKMIALDKIEKVIFTHLHYDHIGNADLFPNAKFFASKQEIKDFRENPELTVLNADILAKSGLQKIELKPIVDMNGLKVINTPGHTRGSICLWYEKEKVLFTGDTFFSGNLRSSPTAGKSCLDHLCLGRTDLPTSIDTEMKNSIEKLRKLDFKIVCPGHDY